MVRLTLALALSSLLAPFAVAQAGKDDEKGFETVFNGKDFAGIKFFLGKDKTEPGETFKVQDGIFWCSGKPNGYWYTEKKYKTFTLRFDYRYKRPETLESDDKFNGNSGYLLFINEHQVWPKSIEVQGYNKQVLTIIAIKCKAKFTVDNEARKKSIKPVGEWNSVEIVAKDGQVKSSLNGTLISTVSEHEFAEAGHIGFQSEGAEIHWRNIRIKAE